LYVYALNVDDGVQIETQAEWENLQSSLTSAFKTWVISPGELADTFISVDIKDVIQEIVDRPGWVNGNSISIFVKDGVSEVTSFIQIRHLFGKETLEVSLG
jgi:hypothetical protein